MRWLSDISFRSGNGVKRSDAKENNLGILSFETAKTMSAILSLYRSLSDHEIMKLRMSIVKSKGVSYLNSSDEDFLLGLACAEWLEELDRAAADVARLGKKCSDPYLTQFDHVYTNLKLGIVDFGKLHYGSRETQKVVEKMEGLTSETSSLYAAMEAATELEKTERSLSNWSGTTCSATKLQRMNFDLLHKKIAFQKKQVRRLKQLSLWSKTFNPTVDLMARAVCIVHMRIHSVFGLKPEPRPWQQTYVVRVEQVTYRSGPISKAPRPSLVRFYSGKSTVISATMDRETGEGVFHAAGETSLGGSGLALRYANLIVEAERCLEEGARIEEEERRELYELLPEKLKRMVTRKLRRNMRREELDELLAEGWRAAVREIMGWLLPMAQHTLQWQSKRSLGKTSLLDDTPSVLLLQTLHFSDKEKAEAAIAEVLVGLSCVHRYENSRSQSWG